MTALALVGLGDIGRTAHLPALRRHPEVTVAAVVDPVADRRAGLAEPALPDLDAVLADDRISGVVLATPPWVTTELAARALRAGRFVLAEKPIATATAAARPLADLPAGQRARLQVGLTYRHDPALARLREWITDGVLGERLLCRAHIYDEPRDADPAHAERIRADLAYGPPVLHEGSHVFDWLSFLFDGPPESIEDTWALGATLGGARLRYAGGVVALTEFGWWADRLPRCELSVLGERGYAVLDCATFTLRRHSAEGEETVTFPGERTVRCFDRQLARFVDLVTGRIERAVPGFDEGLAALQVSERIAAAAGPRAGEA